MRIFILTGVVHAVLLQLVDLSLKKICGRKILITIWHQLLIEPGQYLDISVRHTPMLHCIAVYKVQAVKEDASCKIVEICLDLCTCFVEIGNIDFEWSTYHASHFWERRAVLPIEFRGLALDHYLWIDYHPVIGWLVKRSFNSGNAIVVERGFLK